MKNRYEGLLILNTKGNDDGAKDIIERLEKDFKTEGADIEQVQKMDKRQFTYVRGPLDQGYYVNFIFHGAPGIIAKLKAKFTLDETVYRQSYLKVRAPRPAKERKARAA